MYTQDLNTAFMVENERCHAEMMAAEKCHLAYECLHKVSKLVSLPMGLLDLFLAFLAILKRP